MPHVGSSPLTS